MTNKLGEERVYISEKFKATIWFWGFEWKA